MALIKIRRRRSKKLYQKSLNKNVRRDEIRLMAQLFQRGFGSVEDCFDEIISRRGDEIKEELIIGKILDPPLIEKLKDLNSDERDDLLEAALKVVKVYKKNKLKFTLGTEKFYLSLVPEGNSDIYIKIVANGFEESITKQLGKLYEQDSISRKYRCYKLWHCELGKAL